MTNVAWFSFFAAAAPVFVACVCAASAPGQTPETASRPVESRPATPAARRVGGDLAARAEKTGRGDDVKWTAGRARITTPLPEGYAEPTPPGAIDVKSYPVVRRAEVARTGDADLGRNLAFWPLFSHIEKRKIAMTSPVEMNYAPAKSSESRPTAPAAEEGWTMSFLYRTRELGPLGKDGAVTVADAPELTVVSLGAQGSYARAQVDAAVLKLRAWLASQDEFEEAGDPRALYYNGPDVRNADKWSEIQLPVRRRPAR